MVYDFLDSLSLLMFMWFDVSNIGMIYACGPYVLLGHFVKIKCRGKAVGADEGRNSPVTVVTLYDDGLPAWWLAEACRKPG